MKLLQEPKPLPSNYADAVRFLANKNFIAGSRYRSQQWRAERKGAHPDILAFEQAFIRRMRKLGIPIFAHCVVRSNAVQARHFVQGVTKAKPGQSPHNHGKAVDLIHGIRAWDVPKVCWDLYGHVGKEVAKQLGVKVAWGGDWNFYDPAHWELEDWRHYPADPTVAKADLEAVLALYELA